MSLERVKIVIEIIRVLAWPTLAATLVWIFYVPLSIIASGLATKFDSAKTLSVGSVKIEFREKLRDVGGDEFLAVVGKLSPAAILELLRIPVDGPIGFIGKNLNEANYLVVPNTKRTHALVSLQLAGYIDTKYPLELSLRQIDDLTLRELWPSPSGQDVYDVPDDYPIERLHSLKTQTFSITEQGISAREAILKALSMLVKESSTANDK